MKTFLLLLAAAAIFGGIYHTEVSQYVSNLAAGSSRFGGGPSVVGSMKDMGTSGKSAMGGVGNALNR